MGHEQASRLLGLTPYLYYEDAGAALDWLATVCGFAEDVRYLGPDGRIEEAEMLVGPSRIMIGGRAPGPDEGRGQELVVHVDDVDAHHARAVAAGQRCQPPEDRSYGARTYVLTDPGGYRWIFWQTRGEVQLQPGWTAISR